ncbi:regulatory protein RecX [Cyclobacterium jeungdonense]|uniref:Regulatory protein RecX n=1 Tax=Cyclobacterium jeungdonense TaxID=708087 RepID=A0ABT8CB48_9BACT|nr:regulatory protein RecX [Cyclobacterium jeungdonense]MDN3689735.1 regulatory protein RecX [Cyclobacterium jeungdonense]
MSIPEKGNAVSSSKKKVGFSQGLKKISSYCAYQERCLMEVQNKLEEWGLTSSDTDKIIGKLLENDFLNEGRFVESYVRGKFGLKKWGKVRIRQELKMREISDDLIRDALEAIDEREYQETLKFLADRKWKLTREPDLYKKKAKVTRFLAFRGFEPDLIRNTVDELAST